MRLKQLTARESHINAYSEHTIDMEKAVAVRKASQKEEECYACGCLILLQTGTVLLIRESYETVIRMWGGVE